MLPTYAKALVLWFGILILAIFNGWLREDVLNQAMGSAFGQASAG